MSDALLVSIAALIFVGAPLMIIAWAAIVERHAGRDDPHEPGDQSHHPASIEQARRANGRRSDV
jgi:hypothetical protein